VGSNVGHFTAKTMKLASVDLRSKSKIDRLRIRIMFPGGGTYLPTDCVMGSLLSECDIDLGFKSWSGKTKDYTICIC
jgi:hypothetical protein